MNTPNEEALRLTYLYLMTAEGSAALAALQLPEAERSALMQRAAEDALPRVLCGPLPRWRQRPAHHPLGLSQGSGHPAAPEGATQSA